MRKLKLQFGLGSIFIVVALSSFGLAFGRYCQSTEELRETLELVQNASSGEQAQRLYSSLVWNDERELCKRLGLNQLRTLSNEGVFPKVPEIVWKSRFKCTSGEQRRVFLLSATMFRPHFTTIVVTDDRYRLVCWSDSQTLGHFISAYILHESANPSWLFGSAHWEFTSKHVERAATTSIQRRFERSRLRGMMRTLDELMPSTFLN